MPKTVLGDARLAVPRVLASWSPQWFVAAVVAAAATVGALVGVLGAVGVVEVTGAAAREPRLEGLLDSGTALAYSLLGVAVVVWASRDRGALALGLAFAAIGLSGAHGRLEAIGWVPPGLRIATFTFGAVAFVRATQLFPAPLRRADVAAAWRARALRPAAALLGVCVGPAATWLGVGGALLVLPWLLPRPAGLLIRPAVLVAGLAYLYTQYRIGDEPDRRRVFWFLQAVVVAAAVAVVGLSLDAFTLLAERPVSGRVDLLLSLVSTLGVVTCSAIGIFFAGALDPRLAIQRTAVLGAVVSLVVLLMGVIEQLVSQQVAQTLGLDTTISAAVSGTLVGAVLRPVHRLLKRSIGRALGLEDDG
ncbi:MAG TPA: hypothetical protein VF212_09810 [Longimicrobiales bacterium]